MAMMEGGFKLYIMKSKYLSLFIISNYYGFIGVSHEVLLENYSGNWLF